MNTKQIECILEVSKTLNFNRAAENLFISQPSLSYQIQTAEQEIGFKIFERSGKGATLTFAGKDFCYSLERIQKDLFKAIEHGQNLNRKYDDDISIGLSNRSAIHYLPDAIKTFTNQHPTIAISPIFRFENRLDSFLNRECDIFFSLEDEIKNVPNIVTYPLYKSKVYLVTKKDDPLASKEMIYVEDLVGRTLIIGGKAPKKLKQIQRKILDNFDIEYLNSPDHGTTLLDIASDQGICLAPGFLNDHNDEFAWIPFSCDDVFECVLSIHDHEKRQIIFDFIKHLQSYYINNNENL